MSTRISDAAATALGQARPDGFSLPEDAVPGPTAEERLERNMARWRLDGVACGLRSSGVPGAYRTAECELGARVAEMAVRRESAYLYGDCGAGKTHAACCAVRLWLEETWPSRALFGTARSLLEKIKGDGWTVDVLKVPGLLVIDDLGAQRDTDWAVEQLEEAIDWRVANARPTIVTSNLRVGELAARIGGTQGRRMASRLATFERIQVTGPDRRIAS